MLELSAHIHASYHVFNKPTCSSSKFIPSADIALQIHDDSTITQQQQQQHHIITTQPETLHIQEETIHTTCPNISNFIATQSCHDDSHTNEYLDNDSSLQHSSLQEITHTLNRDTFHSAAKHINQNSLDHQQLKQSRYNTLTIQQETKPSIPIPHSIVTHSQCALQEAA